MTEEDEEFCKITFICRFCEENVGSDKGRHHCQLTDKFRGPAHSKCNINVTQERNSLIPTVFQNFSKYDCHRFLKKVS